VVTSAGTLGWARHLFPLPPAELDRIATSGRDVPWCATHLPPVEVERILVLWVRVRERSNPVRSRATIDGSPGIPKSQEAPLELADVVGAVPAYANLALRFLQFRRDRPSTKPEKRDS
jgi:hypothetical protein